MIKASTISECSKKSIHRTLQIATIGLAVIICYYPTLHAGFVFDDLAHVPPVTRLSTNNLDGLVAIFKHPTFPGNLYRPVFTASLWLTHHICGADAFYFHATNILLHFANCLLCLWLLRRLCNSRVAFVASMFFAVHPIHVEVVSNISYRTELLQTCFGLCALNLLLGMSGRIYESGSVNKRLVLCIPPAFVFLLAAFLSKESALIFVGLIPLTIGAIISRNRRKVSWIAIGITIGSSFAAYTALRYLVMEASFLGNTKIAPEDNFLVGMSAFERVLNACVLLGRYICLNLLPLVLRPDYSLREITPLTLSPTLSDFIYLACLVIAIALTLCLLIKKLPSSIWAIWFFLSFLLTSNLLFPIGTIFAERLSYLPSLAICTMVALLIESSWTQKFTCSTHNRFAATKSRLGVLVTNYKQFITGAIIIAMGSWTFVNSRNWMDDVSLGLHMISVSPHSVKAQNRYADLLRRAGRLSEAEHYFRMAFENSKGFAQPAYGLSKIAQINGNQEDRLRWLEIAHSRDPQSTLTLAELGNYFLEKNQVDQAALYFVQVLNSDNRDSQALLGLAYISTQKDQVNQARKLLNQVLEDSAINTSSHKVATEMLQQLEIKNTAAHP